MKIYRLILATFLCLNTAVVFSQESNTKYDDASKLINVWLEAQKDYEDIPFISGVVVKDQKVLWSGAFGNANYENLGASNENSMSSICSASKVFTATAIMKLVDEGKINLNDKVKDILPKFSVNQKFPEGGSVTIRSLLSHSSGLPRDSHSYWSGPEHYFPTEDELFEVLSTLETVHAVGAEITYSNIGSALQGLIVEKVTGGTYKDYVESTIFQPLEMSNSFVEMQLSLYGNRHVMGYSATNRNGERKIANFYQTKAMQAAAGISTTALDLAKFAKWQFRLVDASKAELMKPSTLKSMYEIQATTNKDGYNRGFGYEVTTDKKGNEWAMHGGVCPGYVSYFKMNVTNKMGFAILANANRINTPSYVRGLVDILNRADSIEQGVKPKLDLSPYVGFYNLNPWNSEYYVASWGSDLMLLYLPAKSLKYAMYHYQHVEGDTFQLIEDGKVVDKEFIKFIRDEQGNIVKVKNGGNYHSRVNIPK